MGLSDQTILFTLQAKDLAGEAIDNLKKKMVDLGIVVKEAGDEAAVGLDKLKRAQEEAAIAAKALADAEQHAADADARASAAAAVLAREEENVARKSADAAAAQELLAEASKRGGEEHAAAAAMAKKATDDQENALKRLEIAQRSVNAAEKDQGQAATEIDKAKKATEEADKSVKELTKSQKELEKANKDSGNSANNASSGFAMMGTIGTIAFGSLIGGAMGLKIALIGMPVLIAAIGVTAAAGAAVAGAALALLPLGFAALGIAALASNTQVSNAFKQTGETLKTMIQQDAAPMIPYMIGIAKQATAALKTIAPDLKQIFVAVGPEINVAAQGIIGMVENMMYGVKVSIQSAMPVMQGFSSGLKDVGTGLGQMFLNMSTQSAAAGQGLKIFLDILAQTLADVGAFIAVLAAQGNPALVAFGTLLHGLFDMLDQMLPVVLKSVVPAFVTLVDNLNSIIHSIGQLIMAIAPLASAFTTVLGTALAQIVRALVPLAAQFINMALIMLTSVIPPLQKLAEAILQMLGPVLNLVGAFAQLVAPIVAAAASLAQMLVPVVQALANNLSPVIRLLGEFVTQGLQAILGALQPLMKPLTDFTNLVGAALVKSLQVLLPPFQDLLKALVDLLQKAVQPLIVPIGQLVAALAPSFANTLAQIVEHVTPMVKSFGDFVGIIAGHLGEVITWVAKHKELSDILGTLLGVWAGLKLALLAYNTVAGIATGLSWAASIATGAWTAAMWLLNIALDADPIVLIILAIVGLIAILVGLEMRFHFVEKAVRAVSDFFSGGFTGVMNHVKDLLDGPFGAAVKGVIDMFMGPVGMAITTVIGHWGDFTRTIGDVIKALGDFTKTLGDNFNYNMGELKRNLSDANKNMGDLATTMGGNFKSNMHDLNQATLDINKHVNDFADTLGGNFKSNMQQAGNDFANMWHAISSAAVSIWTDVTQWFTRTKDDIGRISEDAWHNVSNFFQNMWHDVSQWVMNLWHDGTQWLTNLQRDAGTIAQLTWQNVSDNFQRMWHDVGQWVQNMWHEVSQWFQNLWHDVSQWSQNTWHDVSQWFQNMWHESSQWAQNTWHEVSGAFINLWHEVSTWAGNMWHEVTSKFAGMRDDAVNIFRDLANRAFVDPINWVINTVIDGGLDGILGAVDGVLGTNWHVHVNQMGHFASGGVVPGYAPGQDTFHALLSPGEGVLVPEVVQALGGPSAIEALNSQAPRVGSGGLGGPRMGADGVWRASLGGVFGDVWNGITGAFGSIAGEARKLIAGAVAPVAQGMLNSFVYPLVDHLPGSGAFPHDATGVMTHQVGQKLIEIIKGKDQAAQAALMGGGIQGQFAGSLPGWIAAGEAAAGVGGDWTAGLMTLIARESGGNPNAINLWDSNAAAGHPSKGLMQEIDSTFAANHVPGTSDNIYDPVANIAAGIRYIQRTYGGIQNVQQANPNAAPRGYDEGGYLGEGDHWVFNHSGRPEMVLPPRLSEMMEHLHDRWDGRRGDDDDDRWGRWHHGWGRDHDRDDWDHHETAAHELGEFLSTGQSGMSGMRRSIGTTSMMTALGLGLGSGNPFGGLFLADNPGQSIGQQVGGNGAFWDEALEHDRWAQLHAIEAQQRAFSAAGRSGNTRKVVGSFAGSVPAGSGDRAGIRPGDNDDRGPGGVYVDCRGATLMSDRAMDDFVEKIGNRMSTWTMPAAGVRIRR